MAAETARELLKDMGFDVPVEAGTTQDSTLRDLQDTIAALLDLEVAQAAAVTAARRGASRVHRPPPLANGALQQYTSRASQHLGGTWAVVDPGIAAATTANACFWLCVAAGWSRVRWRPLAHSALNGLRGLVGEVGKASSLQLGSSGRPLNGKDPLGILADELRRAFCGVDGLLLTLAAVRTWGAFYAATTPAGAAAPEDSYRTWIQRVGQREFADEIIMAAVALMLELHFVCIPHTPETSQRDWKVREHPGQAARGQLGLDQTRTVVLGNNDVHYVWLCRWSRRRKGASWEQPTPSDGGQ